MDVLLSRLGGHFDRVRASIDFREMIEQRVRAPPGTLAVRARAGLALREVSGLLSRLEAWVYSPQPPGVSDAPIAGDDVPDGDLPVRRFARVRIDKTFAKLALWIDRPADSLTDSELHRIRILFKRLRYACEFFRPLLGDDAGGLIGSFVGFQDCLGLHQDAVTALQLLSDTFAEVPGDLRSEGFLLSAGALLQVQRDIQFAQRERFVRRWKSATELLTLWKGLRSALGDPG